VTYSRNQAKQFFSHINRAKMMNRFAIENKLAILNPADSIGRWVLAMAVSLLSVLSAASALGEISEPKALGQSTTEYRLRERSIVQRGDRLERTEETTSWDAARTAVIVCDVWDYHHSVNAVRRLEEMLPSMDKLLQTARQSGSVIIHAPSDCMPHYAEHPARLRAIGAPKVDLPRNIVYGPTNSRRSGAMRICRGNLKTPRSSSMRAKTTSATKEDTNLPLPAKFALPHAVYYTLETP
jgi:hypothetical protein